MEFSWLGRCGGYDRCLQARGRRGLTAGDLVASCFDLVLRGGRLSFLGLGWLGLGLASCFWNLRLLVFLSTGDGTGDGTETTLELEELAAGPTAAPLDTGADTFTAQTSRVSGSAKQGPRPPSLSLL